MRIIIPTYKRAGLMTTHKNIPEKYHSNITLVVRENELDAYKAHYPNFDYFVVHTYTDGLPATRQKIMERFSKETYWVFDDDLDFIHVSPNTNPTEFTQQFIHRKMTEADWADAFDKVEESVKAGYSFGGFKLHGSMPSTEEFAYNTRITTNQWWHGPSIPKDIDCTRVRYAEDLDIIFQLLSKGCQSITFNFCCASNASRGVLMGGCKDQRTADTHNESSLLLQRLWPEYVLIKSYINKTNPLYEKGKEVLKVKCYFTKARKDYLKSLTQEQNPAMAIFDWETVK